ncbi:uncharacterized protein LOC132624076 [Lycium barbarum]|uniref:uncharacterized protein LOC132624076 n=1 Tax=Lycium barbarum TaxID=112863 RepID=UPI00293E081C|nr:uncharacterized protein LOC132624076 [Lycium barbarum]
MLFGVHLANNCFESILSSCPVLQRLLLHECSGVSHFNISGSKLKNLSIKADDDVESIYLENTPNLTEVSVSLKSVVTGETSSEDAPLQRKRSGEAVAVETEKRTEPVPEIEAPTGARPSPENEPATTVEPSTFAEFVEAAPSSSAPATRVDEFDDMFSRTPPASCEAVGFGHLPIPRATRPAYRAFDSGARDSLVNIFPAPSVEPRRTRSAVVTVPEDCSFLSRPVGVASYLRPLVSDSDRHKMTGVTWECLINEGMHAGNRSVVLVNEAFIRARHEIDDLRGQLDAQGREIEKYQHLLREKEEELNRAVMLANLRPELDAVKDENRRLKSNLAAMTDYNRSLEAEKIGLCRDKTQFSLRLDELETTISQLRGELDSVRADATGLTERNRQLESEAALFNERSRVLEEKVEERARLCEGLRTELEEAINANDTLKAELDAANLTRDDLERNRAPLETKLAKAEADLEEAWKSVEAAEAHTAIVAEYEKWKSRRLTLEQAELGLEDLPALILEAKGMEKEANLALGSESDDSERTESEHSSSSSRVG